MSCIYVMIEKKTNKTVKVRFLKSNSLERVNSGKEIGLSKLKTYNSTSNSTEKFAQSKKELFVKMRQRISSQQSKMLFDRTKTLKIANSFRKSITDIINKRRKINPELLMSDMKKFHYRYFKNTKENLFFINEKKGQDRILEG